MAAKLEQALLPAVSDSPGARILRKMGWRPGQGIGPRLTLAQKRAQDRQLGLAETDVNEMEVDDGGEAAKHTYAPRDTPAVTSVRKADAHGLGYQPGLGLHQQMGNASDAHAGPNLSGTPFLSLVVFFCLTFVQLVSASALSTTQTMTTSTSMTPV
jgi:G patch domain-containing protein 1